MNVRFIRRLFQIVIAPGLLVWAACGGNVVIDTEGTGAGSTVSTGSMVSLNTTTGGFGGAVVATAGTTNATTSVNSAVVTAVAAGGW